MTIPNTINPQSAAWYQTPIVVPGTAHIWIILGASLDILLTGIILAAGGREANPLADSILTTFGFTGMVVFKYAMVFLILMCCMFVTKRHPVTGRKLAFALIAIHFAPVVWSTLLILTQF